MAQIRWRVLTSCEQIIVGTVVQSAAVRLIRWGGVSEAQALGIYVLG